MEDAVRLNKYLSMAGVCSRREADRLIDEGRIMVDGRIAVSGMKVVSGSVVCLDGNVVSPEQKEVILAVHKPCGVVCTTDTRWGDTTLDELVNYRQRVFYVGRLDKNSRGLILMTNQGDLANRMMKSVNFHEKEYLVTVDHDITEVFLDKLRQGIWIEELKVRTRKCKVRKVGIRQFEIILTQGLNRQIRRMCHACGYEVKDLFRTRVLNIRLGDLQEGCYRELTQQEKNTLEEGVYGMCGEGKRQGGKRKG